MSWIYWKTLVFCTNNVDPYLIVTLLDHSKAFYSIHSVPIHDLIGATRGNHNTVLEHECCTIPFQNHYLWLVDMRMYKNKNSFTYNIRDAPQKDAARRWTSEISFAWKMTPPAKCPNWHYFPWLASRVKNNISIQWWKIFIILKKRITRLNTDHDNPIICNKKHYLSKMKTWKKFLAWIFVSCTWFKLDFASWGSK